MYRFKVTYDIKHVNKNSALYGLLISDQICKFVTMQSAIKFAKDMDNKCTSKIQVIGRPIIERI
jgi:hypothetical protein